MEGTVDVEGGGKLENPVSNVSTSEAAVKRHGTTFSACFEMFIAGTSVIACFVLWVAWHCCERWMRLNRHNDSSKPQ